MASGKVTRRGKGWELTINMGYVDGKRQRKRWISKASTKAAATEEMNEELYKLNRVTRTGGAIDNDYFLSDLFVDWGKHIDATMVNPKTISDYKHYVTRITGYLPEHIKIQELSLSLLDDTISRMTKRYANNTINKSLSTLKAVLDYGVSRSVIASNPIKEIKLLPKKKVFDTRALTEEEARALIEVAPPKWAVLWRFIMSTGLRREEVTRLCWSNIDLKKRVVRVLPTDDWSPKTEDSIRTVPLNSNVIADLQKLERVNDYVFVTKNGTTLKNNMLRELRIHMKQAFCKLRGLPYGKRLNKKEREAYEEHREWIEKNLKMIKVHALRYTFCTHLLANGKDLKTVQKLMGHRDPEMIMRIYGQYCHGNAESAVESLAW